LKGRDLGQLRLEESGDKLTETCLTLTASSSPGSSIFDNLSNIRFTLLNGSRNALGGDGDKKQAAEAARKSVPTPTDRMIMDNPAHRLVNFPVFALDWLSVDDASFGMKGDSSPPWHPFLGATPAMRAVEQDAYKQASTRSRARLAREAKEGKWLADPSSSSSSSSSMAGNANRTQQELKWQAFRQAYGWPEGQQEMESLFSPYDSEGIDTCQRCQPEL
jgi:hypothetical protein